MNILRDIRQTHFPPDIDYQYIKKYQGSGVSEAEYITGTAQIAWVAGNRDDFILLHQISVTDRLRSGSVERKPFRDIQKAKAWLGIPDDYEIPYGSDIVDP